tara:strand:- start:8377 stop:9531 length:1155 start_codon:yes stop_codon:yes gene_type:complete
MQSSKPHKKIPEVRIRKLNTISPDNSSNYFRLDDSNGNNPLVDLCSNDYLGLSRDKGIQNLAIKTMREEGLGSGASRFISGSRPIHKKLEKNLGEWLDRETVLLFPSGYQANIAAVNALANRNTIVIADKLIHHSLLVGIRTSGAKLVRYSHNNLKILEKLLEKHCIKSSLKEIVVITESLFSMEGSISPIKEIAFLCNHFGAKLIVDEAHSLGILGEEGKGLSFKIRSGISIISGTFGKAFGGGGAFLACDEITGEHLIQNSGEFRYTTALAPPLAGGALESLRKIQNNHHWGEELLNLSKVWKTKLEKYTNFCYRGDAQILSLITYQELEAIRLQKKLQENGILCIAIRPPTVPQGESRLRITLRRNLSEEILIKLIRILNE